MSGRLRFRLERLPNKWEDARALVDETFRSLRTVLDGGWKWREQVRTIVDVTLETGDLPLSVSVPGLTGKPLTVQLLGATVARTEDGQVISGGVVKWDFRGGNLLIQEISGLAASVRYNVTLAVME